MCGAPDVPVPSYVTLYGATAPQRPTKQHGLGAHFVARVAWAFGVEFTITERCLATAQTALARKNNFVLTPAGQPTTTAHS